MLSSKKSGYYLKKILIFIISILVLSTMVFYISRLAPGDPLASYYGERSEKMSVEEKDAAMERLGLNDPIYVQYGKWVKAAFGGDFGISFKYKQDVKDVISQRIGNTLILGGIGYVLIFIGSLLIGIACAIREDGPLDNVISKIGTLISCIPEFWLSLVLILVFAVILKVLPSGGAYDVGKQDDISNRIYHLILPMVIVVATHLWYYGYMVRNKILEETRMEYVLMARAKGLSKTKVIFKHCLRNVMPAYISIMAISVPHIIGGTYVVETVFSYPGVGALAYESARYADYNLLMVLCIMTGVIVIFFNILGQIINEKIDPRVKARENEK